MKNNQFIETQWKKVFRRVKFSLIDFYAFVELKKRWTNSPVSGCKLILSKKLLKICPKN